MGTMGRLQFIAMSLIVLGAHVCSAFDVAQGRKCERITVPFCKDMKYNMTSMPNLVNQQTQKEASLQLQDFAPLYHIKCSPYLQFFLCSLYTPMCTVQVEDTLVIPVCRSMCLEVKNTCGKLLESFSLEWPAMFDCSRLPETSDKNNNLCMEAPGLKEGIPPTDLPDHSALDAKQKENLEKAFAILKLNEASPKPGDIIPATSLPPHPPCPDRFVYVERMETRRSDSGADYNASCVPRCHPDVLFSGDDKRFAEIWMVVWASVCFLSTSITVLTFLVDTSRFKYPERPVIFLAMCYAVYSLAFMVRAATGAAAVSCERDNLSQTDFLIQEGLESTWCIVVFLLLYFFGMASALWWLILAFTWFLAAGRKWGQEAIQNMASYFHLIAWAVPAIQTIVVLTMRRVDGDELTGLCYVGDGAAMIGFVLALLTAYLLLGTILVLAGFLSMMRIRSDLKHGGANIRKLEKLMAKVGVFALLYTVPAVSIIACNVYEQLNRRRWRLQALETPCRGGSDTEVSRCMLEKSVPTVELFMLKIFMSLVVGITSGMWVWSSKTVASWKQFCSRVSGRQKSPIKTIPAFHQQQNRKQIAYQKAPRFPGTPASSAL